MTIRDELLDENSEEDEEDKVKEVPLWKRTLFAQSTDKPLVEYLSHPLNFDSRESTSRIIKGLEGIIGNLDVALVDIIVGFAQKLMELGKKREK